MGGLASSDGALLNDLERDSCNEDAGQAKGNGEVLADA
jgi:hypothetical protein